MWSGAAGDGGAGEQVWLQQVLVVNCGHGEHHGNQCVCRWWSVFVTVGLLRGASPEVLA